MSAPVALRLCDLLPELGRAAEAGAAPPGPGPPGAAPPLPGPPCYRVGLRAATPRSCRGAPGPRLSAKKRTPAQRSRSLFAADREDRIRREMFPPLEPPQSSNENKHPLNVSTDRHDFKNYALSTPQSANLTTNSIIRECRENDIASLTPLTSSSNYNAKNHYNFAFSNTKKTPLFNSHYKMKTDEIKRDLFTVNEKENRRRPDTVLKTDENQAFNFHHDADVKTIDDEPIDESYNLQKNSFTDAFKYSNADVDRNLPVQRCLPRNDPISARNEYNESISAKLSDNTIEKYSSNSSNYSTESSISSESSKSKIGSKGQNVSIDNVAKPQYRECVRDQPKYMQSDDMHTKNNSLLAKANVQKFVTQNNKIDDKSPDCDPSENIPSRKPLRDCQESNLKNEPVSRSKTDLVDNKQTTSNAKQFKIITIKGKKYTILSKLGSGGSSEVFKVMDPKDTTMYAVKCVNLAVDPSTAENYVNEIKLLRRLQGSDRVVTMYDYDFFKPQKKLYVLLEMGDVDLSSLLKSYRTRGNSLPFPILIGYWTEMLTAVNHIHQNGIIHSDLKPANFLLVHGRLKLIDFGIASSLTSDATSVLKNSTTGTFNYISPEAITVNKTGDEKAKITYRSDVWSLGCILYSMLYGHTPFSHITHLYGKMAALCNPNQAIDYPPIKDVPPVLMQALRWCLTFDVKMRPTVQELIDLPYINYCSETRRKPKCNNNRIPLQTILKIKSALNEAEWQSIAEVLEDSLK